MRYRRFSQLTAEPSPSDLVEARMAAQLTVEQAAEMVGLHRTAYRRQETGKSRVSLAAYRLLKVLGGAMPWEAWAGWHAGRDGALYPPENDYHGYTAADLRQAHWLAQHRHIWRALEAGLVEPMSEWRKGGGQNPNDSPGGGAGALRGGVVSLPARRGAGGKPGN